MMILRIFIGSLLFVLGSCADLDFDIPECISDCKHQISIENEICETKCGQDRIEALLKQESKKQLPKPNVPTVDKNQWKTIELSFNTSKLLEYPGVKYILEVKPAWSPYQKHGVFTTFPYIPKYHMTNQTSYSVKDLEPNTGYQFRVMAIKSEESSEFSDWSILTNTTKNCTKPPCGATNLRIELHSLKPHKRMETLKSVFYWEPAMYKVTYDGHFRLRRLSVRQSWCAARGGQLKENDYEFMQPQTGKIDIITNVTRFNTDEVEERHKPYLYFGCWYTFELYVRKGFFGKVASRTWKIRIPDCIRINQTNICGCPYLGQENIEPVSNLLNISIESVNGTSNASTVYVKWSDDVWQGDVNITYFKLRISPRDDPISIIDIEYYDTYANVHEYNGSFSNLVTGSNYTLTLSAFHDDHCMHHKEAKENFVALSTVCDNVTCPEGQRCRQIRYTKNSGCFCRDGSIPFKGRCSLMHMIDVNSGDDNEAIIAGVVPALVIIILIAVGVIIWLRYFHRKRMNFMQREFEDAVSSNNHDGTLTNHYDYQHPLAVDLPPDGKELNVLYVSQENLIIPDDLLESIGLFELPGERVRLRSMIGKGAFGEVYIGEAQGVNNNPEWTTVAIKTLTESVKEDEVYDFLREIELMKDLGKHENVIQMYGCCTQCRPVCLVLEYASGGNLLNYLRSLKKKCKEIAAARAYAILKSEKEKFEKFFEPGEMPDQSTSYSFPYDPYKKPIDSGAKEVEAMNLEVASKINEELRTALDPMELESFARQIASGMEHVSGLGIVHRDLAARNILLDVNKVLKISDFGLSREGNYIKQTHGKIPFRWLSIEAIVERFYSTASDVWAFGIVLWEICTLGDVPYSSVSDRDLKDFLLSGNRMEKVDSCTDEIYEIMLKCWSHLPEDRPSFTELSKALWDLEHAGNTYVNVDSLMQNSVDDQGDENQQNVEKDNNNMDDKLEEESSDSLPSNGKGLDNPGFSKSAEDLHTNDMKSLIPKKSLASITETTPNEDGEMAPTTLANGVATKNTK